MNKPTILIVAGGENSRFFPLNTETHKGFLELAGEPIVVKALKNLKKHGFAQRGSQENIIIIVAPKDFEDKGFSKYFNENDLANELDLNIQFVLQKNAKGMGDALLSAKNFINENPNSHKSDYFILASPYHLNLGETAMNLWNKRQESNSNCVLSVSKTENPELYGIVKINPEDKNKVLGIIEKPKKTSLEKTDDDKYLKVDSTYLFDNNFFDELSKNPEEEYSLENALTKYAKKTNITWTENIKPNFSLKYPWHLFNAFEQIMRNQKTSTSSTAEISKTAILDDSNGPIIIADGVKVGDFTKILGPCYLGKDVFVGDHSFIRGSSIEEGATVGAYTEVARCIFFKDAEMHFGYISDSVLGSKTQVGAGLITANKRFDRNGVRVKVKGIIVDSLRTGLGIITGNNVKIGIRTNTMPGVLIGSNTTIFPGITLEENTLENENVKK